MPETMVVQGNALDLPLPDESVDLIITSPPYFALRSYRDGDEHYAGQIGSEPTPKEFLDALIAATKEMMRVLKPSGSIWVNLGDKYAQSPGQWQGSRRGHLNMGKKWDEATQFGIGKWSEAPAMGKPKSLMGLPWRYAIRCIDELGLILRAEVVWSKPNSLPESVTDRVRRSHEQWFMFTKEPRYFTAIDEIREPQIDSSQDGGNGRASLRQPEGLSNWHKSPFGIREYNPLGKLPGSVWSIPSEPLIVPEWAKEKYNLPDHFAAFPQEWPRRIILGFSPSSGRVLDPFGGTGTVAMVARALGRTGISLDLSMDYCKLARWRIFESGHAKKTTKRTNQERQGRLI